LAWINARLILRMPLHGKHESPVRMLQRFYGPVLGIERGNPQIAANRRYRPMMSRVHLPDLFPQWQYSVSFPVYHEHLFVHS
jgi:hypothetical protein